MKVITDFRHMVLMLRKAGIPHFVVEKQRIVIEDSKYKVVFMFGEKQNLCKMEVIRSK